MIRPTTLLGVVLFGGMGCGETVVAPEGSTVGQGGGSMVFSSAWSSASGTPSGVGGAAPTNCWGCSYLSSNWFTGYVPPAEQICPGALDLAEQTTTCYCQNCAESCPFCNGGTDAGCNDCLVAHCKELGEQCGADKRMFDPEK
jgi:hypothetical protein